MLRWDAACKFWPLDKGSPAIIHLKEGDRNTLFYVVVGERAETGEYQVWHFHPLDGEPRW